MSGVTAPSPEAQRVARAEEARRRGVEFANDWAFVEYGRLSETFTKHVLPILAERDAAIERAEAALWLCEKHKDDREIVNDGECVACSLEEEIERIQRLGKEWLEAVEQRDAAEAALLEADDRYDAIVKKCRVSKGPCVCGCHGPSPVMDAAAAREKGGANG